MTACSAIDLDPQNAVLLSNRAAANLKVGTLFVNPLRLISTRPGRSFYCGVLVCECAQLHDYRNAIEDCSQAIRITPSIKVHFAFLLWTFVCHDI